MSESRGAGVGRVGMWVFLATDVMGFGGLLLAYALLRVRAGAWPDPATRFDRPLAAALTFVLLLSGATVSLAVAAAREGRSRAARVWLALTALAGLVFVAGQAAEFQGLAGARHIGLTADQAAAIFYVITAYHGIHVLVGVAVLLAIAIRAKAKTAEEAVGVRDRMAGEVDVAALYWQFVDVVWIVIFSALYLLPPVIRG